MNYRLFIARRYLFSRKSHHAINIISGISVAGVAIATMAMVCTLSVFNGFRDLVAGLFTAFDPQLRVTLTEGSSVSQDDEALQRLRRHPDVKVYTPVMEGQALVVQDRRQQVVTVMGVADNFTEQASINNILYGDGSFCLHADVLEYGVLGLRLAARLGLPANFPDPLQVYAPKRGERVNMANPLSSFNHDELQSPGVVFNVQQSRYDDNYIITSLGFAQRLFDQRGRITSVELRLRDGVSLSSAKRELRQLLGARFQVQDRFEQQADVFRIMRIEKLISFVFLTFILLIACFNIIGSLSMLMIDKRQDMRTLRSLGATDGQVCDIFMLEGRMISLAGAAVGLLLGLALCWLQQEFGLISMGSSAGSFIVEAYPVSVHVGDLVIVFLTVLVVGWAAVWWPVRYLSRRLL
ncbi:MAG: FtsX-like permease family protein [Prevotellaceae bacterium]|nr:FtsX-like permease family protein [Prevotellaceae bacterium]MDD7657099.1 FtsX-like permease family protein [Prevotellaceae bacterium]